MASPAKKQKLSQRKLSGMTDYAISYNKEQEQQYPISPGGTAKEF